jgi:lipid-A-disaccharide synthase
MRRLMPLFCATAERLFLAHPELCIVVPAVSAPHARQLRSALRRAVFPWRVLEQTTTRELAARCRLVLVKSGTAALEAALSGTPCLIAYKLHPVSWWVLRRVLGLAGRLSFVGLPNLLAGREIVPEFLQAAATPQRLAAAAQRLLVDPAARRRACRAQSGLTAALGKPGASHRAAAATAALLRKRSG